MLIYALPTLGKSTFLSNLSQEMQAIDTDMIVEYAYGWPLWKDIWAGESTPAREASRIEASRNVYRMALPYISDGVIVLTNLGSLPSYTLAIACSDDYVKRVRRFGGDSFKDVKDETLRQWRNSFVSIAARSSEYHLVDENEFLSHTPQLRWVIASAAEGFLRISK